MSTRLAIIWNHFGPYHMARIRALHPHFEVSSIELASDQRLYRWWRGELDSSSHTLTSGDWEDQNKLLVAIKLWRKLTLLQPAIILVPGYASLAAISAALWGCANGAATIVMSESNIDDRQRSYWSETLKALIVRLLFSGGIAGGKRSIQYLERLGLPAHHIASGYDVVDNQYFASCAQECRNEPNNWDSMKLSPYFLYVGRLAPEKNIFTLLDAFRQYRNSGGIWPLVIVGDGPLNQSLQAHAHLLDLSESVHFVGRKSVQELPSFYAFAGCFVLPSVSEPWGLVVNEAMATGLPVIASSRCGCADDLVEDGANGFIINPCEVASLAEALRRISNLSVGALAQMGERSQAIIARYSLERWASELVRISSMIGKDRLGNAS